MNLNKKQLIALTLTNIANIDSEVNLLANPSGANNSPFDTYYEIDFLDTFSLAVKCKLSYTLSGTAITYIANGGLVVANINNLIIDLNANLGSYALFSYKISPTPSTYTLVIKILNSNFIPTLLEIYN
jgi:hypothetical protein